MSMSLRTVGMIDIPDAAGSEFDHAAFDPATRRIFVAHTGRDRIEVIDHDAGKHIATLPGFPEAAGVVADDGAVLVTNRGAASLAWLDAHSLKTQAVFKTGPRPNGVAIVPQQGLAIVASIGDENHGAKLEMFSRDGRHHAVELPGRPRWCVTDAAAKRVFLAIRDPVIKALRAGGIEVTALHSHMLDEQPRLFFVHFWANDNAVKLAKALRTALDEMANVKNSL